MWTAQWVENVWISSFFSFVFIIFRLNTNIYYINSNAGKWRTKSFLIGDSSYSVGNLIFFNKIGNKSINVLGQNEKFHYSAEFLKRGKNKNKK